MSTPELNPIADRLVKARIEYDIMHYRSAVRSKTKEEAVRVEFSDAGTNFNAEGKPNIDDETVASAFMRWEQVFQKQAEIGAKQPTSVGKMHASILRAHNLDKSRAFKRANEVSSASMRSATQGRS